MASRNDFTDDQWKLVTMGPTAAGMLVIASDRGGTIRESFSMAEAYAELRERHGESELLDAIANSRPKVDRKIAAPEEMAERNLQHVRDAVAVVVQKGDKREVQDYKDFVRNVATHVAEARDEDKSGQPISDKEQQALDEIDAALG